MQDFLEQIRKMHEAAYRSEGYEEVEAIVVDRDADCESDARMKTLVEQGYSFVDENFFGDIGGSLGKVVVFVKGKRNA